MSSVNNRKRKPSSTSSTSTNELAKRRCRAGSCDECRRTKKKCEYDSDGNTSQSRCCKNCINKGFSCEVTGCDRRTHDTERRRLDEALSKYLALVKEFLTQLELMAHQSHTEQGQMARRYLQAGKSPSLIISEIKIPSPSIFEVQSIPALQKYDRQFETLKDLRAALRDAEKAAKKILASLVCALMRCLDNQISEDEVTKILKEARQNRYRDGDNFQDPAYESVLDRWYPMGLEPGKGLGYVPSLGTNATPPRPPQSRRGSHQSARQSSRRSSRQSSQLSPQLGSMPSNPIIIPEEDEGTAAAHSSPSTTESQLPSSPQPSQLLGALEFEYDSWTQDMQLDFSFLDTPKPDGGTNTYESSTASGKNNTKDYPRLFTNVTGRSQAIAVNNPVPEPMPPDDGFGSLFDGDDLESLFDGEYI
ncbi:hypothetical protein F4810DRAFT_81716 [Camillea tinctor]|nr:hypothetical protein F4810DRAFT_81716 [Camillea tinctor]